MSPDSQSSRPEFGGRIQSPARPILLSVLLLGALLFALLYLRGQSAAAPSFQTSPQTSVVSTPDSVVPTPTPTPTPPVPPTLTPPAGLETWPTPSPTPYAGLPGAAIDFVAESEEIDVSELVPQIWFALAGGTGNLGGEGQVGVVQLLAVEAEESYWVSVREILDEDGDVEEEGVEFLPIFEDEALALAAEEQEVEIDELEILSRFFVPYPFSGEIIWTVRILDTVSNERFNISFALDGTQVLEEEELLTVEEEAIEEFCGALDQRLCREIRMESEATLRWVQLVPGSEDEDSETIEEILESEGYTFTLEGSRLATRLPNSLTLALGRMDEMSILFSFTPDEIRPLDSNLVLGFREDGDGIGLVLESQKSYPYLNYRIEASLLNEEISTTEGISLVTTIDGVFTPASGPATPGSARADLSLGADLSGRNTLILRTIDRISGDELIDVYTLLVADSRLVVQSRESSFSWPAYSTWLRLPPDTIWFVVQARESDEDGVAFDVTRSEFLEKVSDFYSEIEAMDAQALTLAEGIYTNDLFVPPWEGWQLDRGDRVEVPVSGTRSYLFRWPDIRYYQFDGDLDEFEDLVEEHCVDEVWITGYSISGEILESCGS